MNSYTRGIIIDGKTFNSKIWPIRLAIHITSRYYQQIFIKGLTEHTSLWKMQKKCSILPTKMKQRELKISHEHSENNGKIEFNDGEL